MWTEQSDGAERVPKNDNYYAKLIRKKILILLEGGMCDYSAVPIFAIPFIYSYAVSTNTMHRKYSRRDVNFCRYSGIRSLDVG